MRNHKYFGLVAAGGLLLASLNAYAGTNYQFNCTGSSSLFSSLALVSFNLPILAPVSAGAKQVLGTFTIVFPADLNSPEMLKAVLKASTFASCTLVENVTTVSNKGVSTTDTFTWTLTDVIPTALTGIGSDTSNTQSGGTDSRTAYMQMSFEFVKGQLDTETATK